MTVESTTSSEARGLKSGHWWGLLAAFGGCYPSFLVLSLDTTTVFLVIGFLCVCFCMRGFSITGVQSYWTATSVTLT